MRVAIFLAGFFVLAGCASTGKSVGDDHRAISSTGIHSCVVKAGPNCTAKIRWLCPEGFEDACDKDFSGVHKCVATAGPKCRSRIMWQCEEGFANGCDTGQTTNHQCVQVGTALGGSSCANEIVMPCPEGFQDSCMGNEADGPRNND